MTSDQPVKKSRLQAMRLPSLIVGVTVVVLFILISTRPRLAPVEQPEKVWAVNAVVAHYDLVQPQLNLFGEVVAGRRSELRPLVSGLIIEIGANFRDGGIVKQGDVLVQIDPFDYETALAEQRSILKEARARLKMLGRDLERAKDLFEEKTVPEQFLENAELAVIQQETIVEQREINLSQAQRDLAETRLLAPYDGVLNNVSANLGNQVSGFGNDKVADLIDTSRLEVRFSLSNSQYGRLLEGGESVIGRPVRVWWRVGDQSLNYDARIERVGAEIISTTGGVEVFAVIDSDEKQTHLRPGAFVEVSLADKEYKDVLQAPESAIYGEDIVYVVSDGRMAERRIQILGYDGTDVLIRSVGDPPIVDGELIVTTELREAGAGAKVEVR